MDSPFALVLACGAAVNDDDAVLAGALFSSLTEALFGSTSIPVVGVDTIVGVRVCAMLVFVHPTDRIVERCSSSRPTFMFCLSSR